MTNHSQHISSLTTPFLRFLLFSFLPPFKTMEQNHTQLPFIILIFFLVFCYNSAQFECKPRKVYLRYLIVPSPAPNSPPNWQPVMPHWPQPSPSPPKPSPPQRQPTQISPQPVSTPSSLPSPWVRRFFPPSLFPSAPTPTTTPSSQPTQNSPPTSNSPSTPSASSFHSHRRHPSDMPKSLRSSNLFTQSTLPNSTPSSSPVDPAIKQLCKTTDYPELCLSSIIPYLPPGKSKTDPVTILEMVIKACMTHAKLSLAAAPKLATGPSIARLTAAAISDCKVLYSDALDGLQSAMDSIPSCDIGTINSMLSGVVTDAVTCEDGFGGAKSPLSDYSDKLQKMASNCLAIASLIKW